ncbi:MAG TPA: L-lactate dehydrogenase [Noviherbaspirillum sp.]|uniref:L-lactate dehydrogenase n=1 Tax=Noviherbaspirillum sp. TaxID=1926288 RepID=UPI002B4A7B93|nr:L-lactate dehydrogenase [Noviherbaspirillum sp.]HJV84232.1 L-lactate dehydrogenase [Noviherbaspirillum sp.]
MKLGIVGTGHVGSTAAYALVLHGIVSELVLVDNNHALAAAHATDILHATPFVRPVRVYAGDYEALSGCEIVILAAGAGQVPGESRMQLLARNAEVFKMIVPQVMRHAPNPILLVATNPLDIMTQVATRVSGLPSTRVLGSGTILDTARFRSLLGEFCGISPDSVHAYVLGEHGDSEVLVWSDATVAGMPLADFTAIRGRPLTTEVMARIGDEVRRAAYRIIEGKGATYFGIGAALARIARCILFDERAVVTACTMTPQVEGVSDVALSLPVVVGRDGIQMQLQPPLNAQEKDALFRSASLIKQHVASIGY